MPLTRRTFLASSAILAVNPLFAAGQNAISLAAWSFSGSYFQGKWKLLDLPGILRDKLNIQALEHVNQFFENPTLSYLQKLKRACSENGVRSTILMVDSEGPTASPDKTGVYRRRLEKATPAWPGDAPSSRPSAPRRLL